MVALLLIKTGLTLADVVCVLKGARFSVVLQ